ncbi:MAG: hypothetical protein P4L34_05465 [Paludibacter sp.]|nr:hypothetical protein [Paludibacter sp.]
MKKYLIGTVAIIFMFSVSAMAQTSILSKAKAATAKVGDKVSSAQLRADQLAKQLKLTDDQKAKVTTLFTNQDASVAKLKSEVPVGSQAYKTKLEALTKSQDSELKNIIGAEKFEKYKNTLSNGQQEIKDKVTKIKASGLNILK